MALDESTENLAKLESNGIEAYMDPKLDEYLSKMGDIKVDFIVNPGGQSGYSIQIGESPCASGACGSSCAGSEEGQAQNKAS